MTLLGPRPPTHHPHSKVSLLSPTILPPPKSHSMSARNDIPSPSLTSTPPPPKAMIKIKQPSQNSNKNTSEKDGQYHWDEAHSRWLLKEYAQELKGNASGNGIKASAWNAITARYNAHYEVSSSKTRLKNHIQKLKKTYKAFNKARDNSGVGGVDYKQGILLDLSPDFWKTWIEEGGNVDAKPIQKNGFILYEAVAKIMPAEENQATGAFGRGTQSKKDRNSISMKPVVVKQKAVSSEDDDENDHDDMDDKHTSSNVIDTGDLQDQGDAQLASKWEEIESMNDCTIDPQARLGTGLYASNEETFPNPIPKPSGSTRIATKATPQRQGKRLDLTLDDTGPSSADIKPTRIKNNAGTSSARVIHGHEVRVDLSSSDEDIKHGPDVKPPSGRKRARLSGTKAVANSIDAAVKHEQGKSMNDLEITKLKMEKFPNRKLAMNYVQKNRTGHVGDGQLLSVMELLRDEDTASFFMNLSDPLKWEFIAKSIKEA